MPSGTGAAGEGSIAVWTGAAPCRDGSRSGSRSATVALMETPDAGPTRSTPVHAGEPFFHPAPAQGILRTTHEGNYWVLPTERLVAEINIFPLLSNIFFDIFHFFFQNNNKTKKKNAQKRFLKFPHCVFINESWFYSHFP